MAELYNDWIDRLKALGTAFFAVLKAEGEVWTKEIWERSGRTFLTAICLFAAAAAAFVLGLLLLLATFVVVLDIWLPLWAACLVTAGLSLIAMEILRRLGRWMLSHRVADPRVTTRERLDDHLKWWHERVLREKERSLTEGEPE